MDQSSTTSVLRQDEEVLELLREIDEAADRESSHQVDKRDQNRRKVRIPCEIRHVGPDGEKVISTQGRTRDLSVGGLGFLCMEHFRRQVPLLVTIIAPDGNRRHLPGFVVYCRAVRENWFLVGVKFGRSEDERLLPEHYDQTQAVDPQYNEEDGDRQGSTLIGRARLLQALASISAVGRPTRSMIAKAVMATLSPDHVIRQAAIPALMQIGGQDGVMSLMALLDDQNATVRCEAIEALGHLHAIQAIPRVQALLYSPNDEVALRAAEALGMLGDASGKRIAIRLLMQEGVINRRAARALGIIVGRDFRPNTEGVAQARQYLQSQKG